MQNLNSKQNSMGPTLVMNHYTLHPRCLWNCAIEEAKGQSRDLKQTAKGVNNSREGDGARKEEEESSNVAVKHVIIVHRAVCQSTRNLFLDEIHNKKACQFRGETDESSLEAEVSRKSTLEFLEDGGWKHVIMGERKYKGNAFMTEGIIALIGLSVALFTHVPTWMQYRNFNGLKGMRMFVLYYLNYPQFKIPVWSVLKRFDYCETEISEEACDVLSGRNDNPKLRMYDNAVADSVGYDHMQGLSVEKEIGGKAEERFDCKVADKLFTTVRKEALFLITKKPTFSVEKTSCFFVVCCGVFLEPEISNANQYNVTFVKVSMGWLGKRSDEASNMDTLEVNVILKALGSPCKQRWNSVPILVNQNLTGSHVEARQGP